jgi:hypothetical protein
MSGMCEAMGLRYLVWHPASERPPQQRHPCRAYLGWLRQGLVEHGIPRIVRHSRALNDWMPEDLCYGQGN